MADPEGGDRLAHKAADRMIEELQRFRDLHGDFVTFHVIRGYVGGAAGLLSHVWGPKIAFTIIQDVADQAARDVKADPIPWPPEEKSV